MGKAALAESRKVAGTKKDSDANGMRFDPGLARELFAFQQRNAETIRALGDLALKGVETIATQQVAALKSMTDQWTNGNGNLLSSHTPEAWGTALADYMRSWMGASFALAQATAETGCRCCMDAAGLVAKRCAEATTECKTLARTNHPQS
jgi:hypothetical protein